jgi:DNA-binding GntR family transcriptional regulator
MAAPVRLKVCVQYSGARGVRRERCLLFRLYSEYMTACERARSQVLAECAGRDNGALLPSIGVLASQAGVSRMTMWKALLEQCRAGQLRQIGGRRGFAVVNDSRVAEHAETGTVAGTHEPIDTRRESVQHQILADITTGMYAPGMALPPHKSLSHRYGVSHAVLHESLRVLAERGVLVPHRRGYRVFRADCPIANASVNVIAASTDMQRLCAVGTRTTDFWRCLEREAVSAGIAIRFWAYTPAGSLRDSAGREWPSLRALEQDGPVLGHVLVPLGLNTRNRAGLYRMGISCRRPVALLDETPGTSAAHDTAGLPHVAVFSLGFGSLPGTLMGRFLLSRGHRGIAALCLSGGDTAFRARVTGLSEAFGLLGIAGNVRTTCLDRWSGGVSALHRRVRESPLARRLEEAAGKAHRASARSLGHAGSVHRVSLQESVREYARRCIYEQEANELFSLALQERGVTAWVLINDELALMALRYLRRNGVSVPGDLSVAAFDDSVEAFAAGLTSYNFNVAGLARAMLDYLLSRKPAAGAVRSERGLEIPGVVMARSSVRTVRISTV